MAQHYPRLPVKGPVVIPNCVEVIFDWRYAGQRMANVLHGQYSGSALVDTVAQTIYQALVVDARTTAFLAKVHPTCSLLGVRVKDLRAANNPTLESVADAGHPGTSPGTEMPAASSCVVSLRTAKSGKGFFGRVYQMGITQDSLSDARHWNSITLQPASTDMVKAYQSAMSGSGFMLCVAQRALNANTDPNAPPSQQVSRQANANNVVTGIVWTDNRVDSQRRRNGKPGS